MKRKGMNRRVKTIVADNMKENGARITVKIVVEGLTGRLTSGEVDVMIQQLTDGAMLSIARAPYGNVPLSDIKVT